VCAIDGNSTIPGNGVRVSQIIALHTSERPILPSRTQACPNRHRWQMGLYAVRPRKYLPLPAAQATNHLHHLLSHRSPPRPHLSHRYFTAITAHPNPTPTGLTHYHHPQILYTSFYLLRSMMPTLMTITLVLLTKMRYFKFR
jgi:hypothetical protein